MSQKEKLYVGVTGISTLPEAEAVAKIFQEHFTDDISHVGMAGYLVTSDTLRGKIERNLKYPPINELPALLEATHNSGLNILHYQSFDKKTLADQISEMYDQPGIRELLPALQLNSVWPDVQELEEIRKRLPEIGIVLQLGKRALSENRMEILERLERYSDLVNYILLDPSGGLGIPFEAATIASLYRGIKHTYPKNTLVLAGGFNHTNVSPRLQELDFTLQSRNFGIDAEAGLRDTNDSSKSKLDIPKVNSYIQQATSFFTR